MPTSSTATPTTLDLLQFCDTEENPAEARYRIDIPWRDGKHIYATNGNIAVRCKPELWTGEANSTRQKAGPRLPKIGFLWDSVKDVATWRPIPDFPDCRHCRGTLTRKYRCETCLGKGFCDECACGKCEQHECQECKGKRMVDGTCYCTVPFGSRALSRINATKIVSLPGVEWGSTAASEDDPHESLFFRFDGGEGVVMPVCTDKHDEN